jgi:hypothetical protein
MEFPNIFSHDVKNSFQSYRLIRTKNRTASRYNYVTRFLRAYRIMRSSTTLSFLIMYGRIIRPREWLIIFTVRAVIPQMGIKIQMVKPSFWNCPRLQGQVILLKEIPPILSRFLISIDILFKAWLIWILVSSALALFTSFEKRDKV